jgi:predicted AlkP superfamily phosphohydrolase/phosphomutase
MGIPFIILSDHGFTSLNREVYISQYLKQWGFLHLGADRSEDLSAIDARTRAFCLDPARIYIHRREKFKRGEVKKRDEMYLLKDLAQRFSDITIEGQKPIKQVFLKGDIYSGHFLDRAPDMVLLANRGFDLKSGISKSVTFDTHVNEGMHTWDNAFLIDTAGLGLKDHDGIHRVGQKMDAFLS